jgi:hypothetical protein
VNLAGAAFSALTRYTTRRPEDLNGTGGAGALSPVAASGEQSGTDWFRGPQRPAPQAKLLTAKVPSSQSYGRDEHFGEQPLGFMRSTLNRCCCAAEEKLIFDPVAIRMAAEYQTLWLPLRFIGTSLSTESAKPCMNVNKPPGSGPAMTSRGRMSNPGSPLGPSIPSDAPNGPD